MYGVECVLPLPASCTGTPCQFPVCQKTAQQTLKTAPAASPWSPPHPAAPPTTASAAAVMTAAI